MAIALMLFARRTATSPSQWETAGGYRTGGAHRVASAGLAAAFAGLVGVGLATALVAPDVLPFTDPPIRTWNEPLPVIPQPEPDPTANPSRQQSQITVTRPLAPTGENRAAVLAEPLPLPLAPVVGPPALADPVPPTPVPVLRGPQRDPRFIGQFQPPYPAARQREQVEGSCRVMVAIAPNGRVTTVRALACADQAFFRATERQALSRWRFHPATRDGEPVAGELEQNVVFRLTDE